MWIKVFFGDNIPKRVVDLAREKLSNCDALLALGTSIQVNIYKIGFDLILVYICCQNRFIRRIE
jgi:NAD-dependent SIR2 family protein deacetylase